MTSRWGNMVSAHTNQNGLCRTFLSDSLRGMVGFTLPKPCSIVDPSFSFKIAIFTIFRGQLFVCMRILLLV